MSEIETRLAACEAKQAEHDALLARCAALLGLGDTPKAEQPESPSRYFDDLGGVFMIAGDGVFLRESEKMGWIKSVLSPQELLDVNLPEITAEQAEAILKGGGL